MSNTRKKTKTQTKKKVKKAIKKSRVKAKKVAKKPAKKKVPTVTVKKTKKPAGKQAATPAKKKIKKTAIVAAIPEPIKHTEDQHSMPVYNEMHQDRIEENKKSEHQFQNREDAAMQQENQKMKLAMSNRQGAKRIFRTNRHK